MYPTYRITRLQGLISALDDALFGSKSFGTAFESSAGQAHGTRPLAACVGIAACLQHLVGEPRTCCGHLPSGTGSRFVRETRDEQRSGELAAAHPHMRFGLLRTFTSPAHGAAGQSERRADRAFGIRVG